MKGNLTKLNIQFGDLPMTLTVNEKGKVTEASSKREFWNRWTVTNKKFTTGTKLKLRNGDAEVQTEFTIEHVETIKSDKNAKQKQSARAKNKSAATGNKRNVG